MPAYASETTSLRTTTFKSVSGERLIGYLVPVTLSIRSSENTRSGWEWETEVIFSDIRPSLCGVLGNEGFLEFFKFELDTEDQSFYLEENSRFPGRVMTYD